MKLLINSTAICSGKHTGIERYALRITQELCRIDGNIDVICTSHLPGVFTAKKERLLALGKGLLGAKEYVLRAIWDQTIFRCRVKRLKPDVVFFPIQDGMIRPPVKQIVTVHDLHYLHFDKSLTECKNEINSFRINLYRSKMPHILDRSAAVIAVSESTKNDLVDFFRVHPDKIHVIYNGYDELRFHPIVKLDIVLGRYGLNKGGYFLFVGSILRHKNLVRLVQAFSNLNCDLGLVVAGPCKDEVYLQEIMKTVKILGVSRNRFRYLEYVPDEDLPYLYNGATAFVLPSLHEGFGVPLIESMACGTPVITSGYSAMPEVAGKAALYCEPNSVDSISNAMTEILTNKQLGFELKELGFKRAKNFLWSTSANKLYNICRHLCAT